MKVNSQSLPVLRAAIAGALTSAAVMTATGMGAKQVAGSLRHLRGVGLIKGDVDSFKVMAAGTKFIAEVDAAGTAEVQPIKTVAKASKAVAATADKAHNKRSKIAKALTLFNRHQHQGRQAVLAKFQKQLDMTEGGASTYYQLCKAEVGKTASAS